MAHDDLAAHAQALIAANFYLTLGTADPDGRPWISPVYFAPAGDREFYWVSATDARHSRNLAERPEVSLVIFDSTVAPYHGRAVYAVGEAGEVSGGHLDRALEAYPRANGGGATAVTREDVTGAAPYRLYRATASEMLPSIALLTPLWPRVPMTIRSASRSLANPTISSATLPILR